MVATKTREESQIKFGMVKKEWGGGVFSFYPPSARALDVLKKDWFKEFLTFSLIYSFTYLFDNCCS